MVYNKWIIIYILCVVKNFCFLEISEKFCVLLLFKLYSPNTKLLLSKIW